MQPAVSFIALANPPSTTEEPVVASNGWFPNINPADLRATARLDGTVTAARLRHALLAAMASVNAELADWQAGQVFIGYANLGEVPAPALAGESVLTQHYRRAVYAAVQADLAEAYREIDDTPQSAGKAARVTDKLELKVDEHRRNMRWAISDILGRQRTTVDLI